MSDTALRRAACVALLRRVGPGERAIYFTLRRADLPFLGGFLAFPGGGVEVSDADTSIWADPAQLDPGVEAALYGCAARELAEELGLTLTVERGAAIQRDPTLASLDASRFLPLGRWNSPEGSPLRHDTEFFAIELSEDEARLFDASLDATRLRAAGLESASWYGLNNLLGAHQARGEHLLGPVALSLLHHLAASQQVPFGELERCDEPPFACEPLWHAQHLAGTWCVPLRSPTLAPATHTNCYIMGASRFVVVDPGTEDAGELLRLFQVVDALLARGGKLEAIVLTHHHVDHVCGIPALRARYGADVPVWAHARNAGLLDPWAPRVDRALHDGERLMLDDHHALTCYATPGHAPGHLALLHEPSRALFCGDLVASHGTILVAPPQGNMGEYLESLRRMMALAPRSLHPAHGAPIADAVGRLQAYEAHRLAREELVWSALSGEAWRDAQALLPAVYPDVPEAVWPVAALSLEAHLIHLAELGRAERSGSDPAMYRSRDVAS